MSRELTINQNGLLMWRLGPLQFRKQDHWDHEPKNKGMWAFPHPYYEPYFTYHQYRLLAPKKYQYGKFGIPNGASVFYREGEHRNEPVSIDDLVFDKEEYELKGPHGVVTYTYPDGFAEGYEKWLQNTGKKLIRPNKFYWKGSVYCHFTKDGDVISLDEWNVLTTNEFARAIVKSRGDRCYDLFFNKGTPRSTPSISPSKYAHDRFEVFLHADMGKMQGNLRKEQERRKDWKL